MIFDRSKNRTYRNKQRLTNIFNCNFDRLKFWKNQFFEKQSKIMQKFLKALKFMNYMHEYEMKCFSKTQVVKPIFPKLRFSNILPLNSQASNMFCIKHKVFSNLVGQTKNTHNYMYNVQQRVTCVMCKTSNSLRYM